MSAVTSFWPSLPPPPPLHYILICLGCKPPFLAAHSHQSEHCGKEEMWRLDDLIWTGGGFFLELHQAEAYRILQWVAGWRLDFSSGPFYHPHWLPPVHKATVFKGPVTSELVIWHTAVAGHWGLIGMHCSAVSAVTGFRPLLSVLIQQRHSTYFYVHFPIVRLKKLWKHQKCGWAWCIDKSKMQQNAKKHRESIMMVMKNVT